MFFRELPRFALLQEGSSGDPRWHGTKQFA
uniref:Uncharacterized protein n=1 Tax=Nelumbo nucifera TaxID=4432 RepID=A0A822XS68_NELNU|nr:TPA_asm: hypothetical protein HUJ06_021791 [Nelumbo nucifera]